MPIVRPRSAIPEQELWRDSESERRGAANAFRAVGPKFDVHHIFITPDRSTVKFATTVFNLALPYPKTKRRLSSREAIIQIVQTAAMCYTTVSSSSGRA